MEDGDGGLSQVVTVDIEKGHRAISNFRGQVAAVRGVEDEGAGGSPWGTIWRVGVASRRNGDDLCPEVAAAACPAPSCSPGSRPRPSSISGRTSSFLAPGGTLSGFL